MNLGSYFMKNTTSINVRLISMRGYSALVCSKSWGGILKFSILLWFVLLSNSVAAEWIPYEKTPGAVASTNYTISINGQPIGVESFGDVSYARFILTGKVEVVIKASQPITDCAISPLSFKIAAVKKDDSWTFSLTQPRSLILTLNKQEKLFIFADSPEVGAPTIGDSAVTNLASYMPAPHNPDAPVTAEFQKAIDETSAKNGGSGGVLYVPNGQYFVGQLKLKSNVHLYLQNGALIKAIPDFVPELYPLQGSNPKDSSFIFLGKAKNVKVTGRGVIDGNGLEVRTKNAKANIKLMRSVESSDILVDGIYFRNSSRWSLHMLQSESITYRNFKLINDVRVTPGASEKIDSFLVSNTDGVDIDASQHVVIEDSFIYTGDDTISTKVTYYMNLKRPCFDVVAKNNVLWCHKCAIRVGTETHEDMYDILFENNDIVRADRAVALQSEDGGKIYNIKAINNRAEYIGGDRNERFFLLKARKGRGGAPGSITNVLIKDFFALQPAKQESSIEGLSAGSQISGVTFENIVIGGVQVKKIGDIPMKLGDFSENIVVK